RRVRCARCRESSGARHKSGRKSSILYGDGRPRSHPCPLSRRKGRTDLSTTRAVPEWVRAAAGMTLFCQRLLVEDAGGDAVRRQRGIMAERAAATEAEAVVKPDRRCLV